MSAAPIRGLNGPAGLRVTLPFGATYEIWPAQGCVATVFRDGRACIATREDTEHTRSQAAELGYPATAGGVWCALVEHELLHSLLSANLFQRPSPSLRHETGAIRAPTALRLFEESLVLAFQAYLHDRHDAASGISLPLDHIPPRVLRAVRLEFAELLPGIPPRG